VSGSAMVDAYSTEHLSRAFSAPQTPGRGAATASRVVAAVRFSTTTSNIARLASRDAPAFQATTSLLPTSYCATPSPSASAHVPCRHVRTGGQRAMISIQVAPFVGARIAVAPPDFVQSQLPPMVHTNSTQSLSDSARFFAFDSTPHPSAVFFVFPIPLIRQCFA